MKLSEKIKMITEADSLTIWQNQVKDLSNEQLFKLHRKILNQLRDYNSNHLNLEDKEYYTLLSKLDYIEGKLGIVSKIGRELK